MKICYATEYYPPVIGGIETAISKLAEEMERRGHETVVITRKVKGRKSSKQVKEYSFIDLPVIRTISSIPQIVRLARQVNADVYHSYTPNSLLGLLLAGKKPLVLTTHGEWSKHHHFLLKPLSTLLDLIALQVCDKVIFQSVMEKKTSTKSVFIPNSVDTRRFKPSLKVKPGIKKQNMVLYAGRLVERKRVDLLIKAIAKVPKANLVIISPGPEKEKLEALVKTLRLEKQVTFAGRVPEKEMPQYFAACDIFVLPSSFEGFGIVLIEAMACSKPVIAFERAEGTKFIKNNVDGFLLKEDSVNALAKQITKLLNDKKLRTRIGKAALKTAETYSLKRTASSIEKVYKQLK